MRKLALSSDSAPQQDASMQPVEENHADELAVSSMKKIDFDTECALQFVDI